MGTKKRKSAYVCSHCGAKSSRWLGRCGSCGEWNTLEEVVEQLSSATRERSATSSGRGAASARPRRLGEVSTGEAERLPTGVGELDRALGGGPVAGGVVLLGGDPGIGKSTLLLQALGAALERGAATRALYVSGEESASQVALRARRVAHAGIEGAREAGDGEAEDSEGGILAVQILATTELEDAEAALEAETPEIAVIDSIQTLRSRALNSAPGTVTQLREVAVRLIDQAKRKRIALFLIDHVTKEGALAGPKVLEHLVDTVLSFEGERDHAFRLLRASKNRFGPAHEVGVFAMEAGGLVQVPDPSALFLAERPGQASGSVVVPTAEGSRPLLVEVQALVAPPALGNPRRVVSGLDASRLAILLAVLERRAGLRVLERDVFASIAGGARVDERALDLAVAAAVVSSFRDEPVPTGTAILGEVGLAGEVRAVPRFAARVTEAAKLGFTRLLVPRANLRTAQGRGSEALPDSATLVGVADVGEALHELFRS